MERVGTIMRSSARLAPVQVTSVDSQAAFRVEAIKLGVFKGHVGIKSHSLLVFTS